VSRSLPLLLLGVGLLGGCPQGLDSEVSAREVELDEAFYRCRVQPILVKSCAGFICHGDTQRFFRLFGRNRLRYGLPPEKRDTPIMAEETAYNLASAAAFVDRSAPDKSPLLLKPLDQAGGGSYHGGATKFGQGDVFLSKDEADFATLAAWVAGEKEDPACSEPGS
jgi:hypothetical protein